MEEGHFKGGFAAYGYDLVKSGRTNKRKHELYDLKINENEAHVVKLIFEKYTNEGYGAQRIATFLNDNGYRTRKGKRWTAASIRGMLCNPTYMGILRSGESRSQMLPELQIIGCEQFENAMCIRAERSEQAKEQEARHIPLNTKGQSLLAGNVFCGHCGSRLTLTTNGRYRRRKDGTLDKSKRIRYVCYGKTRKQTECNGQTGYTMTILDGIVEKMIKQIFDKMKGVPKSALLTSRCGKELAERKANLVIANERYAKESAALASLKSEIVRCIQGESAFSQDLLAEMIKSKDAECRELQLICEQAKSAVEDEEAILQEAERKYNEIISWAELYDSVSQESKKMIVSCMIKRIEVFEGYKLNVEFNFDIKQFFYGLDINDISGNNDR